MLPVNAKAAPYDMFPSPDSARSTVRPDDQRTPSKLTSRKKGPRQARGGKRVVPKEGED